MLINFKQLLGSNPNLNDYGSSAGNAGDRSPGEPSGRTCVRWQNAEEIPGHENGPEVVPLM